MDKQKYFRGQRVRVAKELPRSMSHFRCDCDAIIDHSYSDAYSGTCSEHDYALLLLLNDGDSFSAWYPESSLTLVSDDRKAGEQKLQDYKECLRDE